MPRIIKRMTPQHTSAARVLVRLTPPATIDNVDLPQARRLRLNAPDLVLVSVAVLERGA